MTREEKLRYHLECIVTQKIADRTIFNAEYVNKLADAATEEDKQAAYQRALVKAPILLEDER